MAEFDREAIDTRIAKCKQAFNDAAGSTKWEDVCMDFAVTGLDDIESCLAEIDLAEQRGYQRGLEAAVNSLQHSTHDTPPYVIEELRALMDAPKEEEG